MIVWWCDDVAVGVDGAVRHAEHGKGAIPGRPRGRQATGMIDYIHMILHINYILSYIHQNMEKGQYQADLVAAKLQV